ncbi:3-hydroxyacyl-CoA dehydrogenase family protein [Rhodococcus sp. NPDC058521]|uniref:3-hydroxyacyl-CoA dehydrogenase family protein n=1 Tax=Rhodococcus sp. NPDC058521 TaxID=3346536 RepID=UPI00364D32E5
MRPSDFADATGRPEKFLALHFVNLVWSHNTGEVMMATKTDRKYFDTVIEFATEIGLEPIPVRKEVPGYVLNSLLIPFLNAAAYVYVGGVANPGDIDKVWRIATGSPVGPFELYDTVGFNGALNIIRNNKEDEGLQKFGDMLEKAVDAGKAGLGDGKGFFEYDADGNRTNPAEEWKLAD